MRFLGVLVPSILICLVAGSALAFAKAGETAVEPVGEANVIYTGHGSFFGPHMAACSAKGAIWNTGHEEITFVAERFVLTKQWLWINRTSLMPDSGEEVKIATPYDITPKREVLLEGSGSLVLRSRHDGILAWYPPRDAASHWTLRSDIGGNRSEWTGVGLPLQVPGFIAPEADDGLAGATYNSMVVSQGILPPGVRGLTLVNGSISLAGEGRLLLRNLRVTAGPHVFDTGPFEVRLAEQRGPGGSFGVRSTLHQELFLDIWGARVLGTETTMQLFCGDLSLEGNGLFTVRSSRGHISLDGAAAVVRQQTLSLAGQQSIVEHARYGAEEDAFIQARSKGGLISADIDFHRVLQAEEPQEQALKALGLLAVAVAVGLTLLHYGPAAAPLFTRLDVDDVIGHPLRRRILDVLNERHGVVFKDLVAHLGVSATTVRYHVGVLRSNGHIQVKIVAKRRFVILVGSSREAILEALVTVDAPLRAVNELLGQGIRPAEVSAALAERFAVTTRTGYRWVEKHNAIRTLAGHLARTE